MLARLKSALDHQNSAIRLLLICLAAFALRLGPLFDNRFHPDEALFSTWALKIARGENLLLTGLPVDKPPLLIYLSALSFYVFGQSELAARVPNLLVSVLSVPLLYQLARRYNPGEPFPFSRFDPFSNRERGAGSEVAALLLALSPFAILFAPTAFLDPAMVMFGLASLVAAARGRAGWAGILLGLSFAAKVQGLFFLLLVPLFWQRRASSRSPGERPHLCGVNLSPRHPIWRFILGVGVSALAVVLLWDGARGGLPFWMQQTINYGGIRLIYAGELSPRLTGWINFLPYFFGPIAGLLGLIGMPILIHHDLARRVSSRATRIDLGLLAYALGFLALHWLLNFPVWDRYLLILVPILALLFGRAIAHLASLARPQPVPRLRLLLVVALAVLPFSLIAARSGYPLGGDHGANDGIEQAAAYLKGLPSGTVVYEHGLAWLLGYYLGDGFAYLSYFDTPADLAADLRVFGGHSERYVIFPGRESPAAVIDAIRQVGYTLTPVFTTRNRFGETSFAVYRIVQRQT
jgi:4-amino-4-deoxy-L-arabinose transferase-like glycosyltransferase